MDFIKQLGNDDINEPSRVCRSYGWEKDVSLKNAYEEAGQAEEWVGTLTVSAETEWIELMFIIIKRREEENQDERKSRLRSTPELSHLSLSAISDFL